MNLKTIGVLIALCSSALAQQGPPPIKTKLVTVSMGGNVEKLFYKSGDKINLFQAYQLGFGPSLDYVGPRRFILHQSEAAFTAEPPGPPPVAFTDLPANSDKVLLLCVPGAEGKLRLVPYDISKRESQAGDYRIFNLSKDVISVILGDKKFVVNPSQDTIVSSQAWRSGGMDMRCQLATVKDGVATKVYASIWGHEATRRNFIFLTNGATATMPIEILTFYDVPGAEVVPPTPGE